MKISDTYYLLIFGHFSDYNERHFPKESGSKYKMLDCKQKSFSAVELMLVQ